MNFNIAKLVYYTFSCLVTGNMMSLICIIIIMAICKSPIVHLVCSKTLGTKIVFNSLESTVIPKRNKIKSLRKILGGKQGVLWETWIYYLRHLLNFKSSRKVKSVSIDLSDSKQFFLPSLMKIHFNVISNQHKRGPLLHLTESVFSHPLHGLVKRFTGTCTPGQIRLVNIQNPLWRRRCVITPTATY